MKHLNLFLTKVRAAIIITSLICGSAFPHLSCEKDLTEPDQEDTFKDPQNNLPSCWTALDNMNKKRNSHMIFVMENKIYVAGGITSKSGNTFESYDPDADSWKTLARMPHSREWGAGCAMNGKIYTFGGWWEEETLDAVDVFDPETNKWTSLSPMPSRRWGHTAVAFEDKIYVVGGVLDWPLNKYYDSVEIYDPETDTWTTKSAPASSGMVPRWGFSACVANNKIYLVGGLDCKEYPRAESVNAMSTVEAYNPRNNSWEEKASMPTARWGLSTVSVNNRIYAMGGGLTYFPDKKLTIIEVYDPESDTWSSKSRLPKGIITPASCVLNNMIYVTGGSGLDPYDEYGGVYVYDPACDSNSE